MSAQELKTAPDRIIKIDPNGKYIFVFPEDTELGDIDDAAEVIRDWIKSDDKFLWARGVRLFKVDINAHREEPAEAGEQC